MTIYIGADHGGFRAKGTVVSKLEAFEVSGEYLVRDLGAATYDAGDDYPVYAAAVARAVAADPEARGILLCRTGAGMAMAANKVDGIRAAVVWDEETARLTRAHNDANIIALGVDRIGESNVWPLVALWLATPFEGGRHQHRVAAVMALEDPA